MQNFSLKFNVCGDRDIYINILYEYILLKYGISIDLLVFKKKKIVPLDMTK